PPARHQLRQARLSLWLADLRNGFVGVAGSGQRKFTAPVLGIMVGTEAFLEDLSLPFCQHIPSESRYRLLDRHREKGDHVLTILSPLLCSVWVSRVVRDPGAVEN
ncbi:hypothetical protein JTM21_39125, partial [Pseudomonas aeruginosa]|nr:hypothetical protein [Pseudomonas aeruginosa]